MDVPPDVVHVQASIEFVGGGVVIATGRPLGGRAVAGTGMPDQLPVTAFGDLMNVLSLGSYGPIVVLETPWRRSRSESVRAMLLRNAFGHYLLELNRTLAVLCTGGGSPAVQHESYRVLAAGMTSLTSPRDIADIAGELRRLTVPDAGLADVVPQLGSALFLQRSPYTLFPVGLR